MRYNRKQAGIKLFSGSGQIYVKTTIAQAAGRRMDPLIRALYWAGDEDMLGKYTDESNPICGGTAAFSNQDRVRTTPTELHCGLWEIAPT